MGQVERMERMERAEHASTASPAGRPWLLAAAVTPLRPGGDAVDEDALAPMAAFLAGHGADGVLACGTTGEGMQLEPAERRRVAELLREVVTGRLIVHCGAQTTGETAALAEHAAASGADGVAVISPPYYRLSPDEQVAHFVAAARACAPVPFYCYAFAARSGYPLEVETIARIRDATDNLAGVKVSEQPWETVAPYLSLGVRILVGNEPLIPAALAAGAAGAVSGLAAAFPDVVRAVLDHPDPDGGARLRRLREALEGGGRLIAAAKHALAVRGVPVGPDLRAPLHALRPDEAATLAARIRPFLPADDQPPGSNRKGNDRNRV